MTTTTASARMSNIEQRRSRIVHLPTEILRQIFISVPSDFARTVRSLLLTCKRFHKITSTYLYPKYNLQVVRNPNNILEDFVETPKLQHLIRSLTLYYKSTHIYRSQDEVEQLLKHVDLTKYPKRDTLARNLLSEEGDSVPALVLALLPLLEEFNIVLGYNTRDYSSHIVEMLETASAHQFQSLTHLHLKFPSSPLISGSLFGIGSLRKVHLEHVQFRPCDDWLCPPYSSLVTDLHISEVWPPYNSIGPHVLRSFAGLRKLRLDLRPVNVATSGWETLLFSLLEPQKHTLEAIELWTNEIYCSTSDHVYFAESVRQDLDPMLFRSRIADRQPLPSLKEFSQLKSLTLTDSTLVGASPDGLAYWTDPPATTVLYLSDMFPPSLEYFTHLLWDGPTCYREILGEREEELRSWNRIWDAVTHPSQFPSLRKVDTIRYSCCSFNPTRKLPKLIWEHEAEKPTSSGN